MGSCSKVRVLWLVLVALPSFAADPDLSIGIRLFEQENFAEARAFFDKHNDGKNAQALYYLGRIAVEQREYETAEAHLEKACALSPDTHEYVSWLGKAYGSHGREADMITKGLLAPKIHKAFLRAVELKPDDVDSRMDLVSFYVEAPSFLGGSFEKAREQAAAIEKLNSAAGARAYAQIARAENKPDQAYAALKKGADANPDDIPLAIDAAVSAQELKRWDESFAMLDGVLAEKPDAWLAMFYVGRGAALSGLQLDRGAQALEKFIAQAPKEVQVPRDAAHNRLGQIYEKLKDAAKARENYSAALKINPENKEAAAGLARVGSAG
jgi:tetratricopeptide (TPR) repeat protein